MKMPCYSSQISKIGVKRVLGSIQVGGDEHGDGLEMALRGRGGHRGGALERRLAFLADVEHFSPMRT